MKYERINNEQNKITLTVTVEKNEWEDMLDHVYTHHKNDYKVQGFRQGKAPRNVIEKMYGKGVFFDDAINHCINKYFDEILKKELDIEPALEPKISIKNLEDNGFTFVVEIEQKPQVKLGDYKGLTIKVDKPTVTEEEVNDRLNQLRENQAKFVAIADRDSALMGDCATIDFSGSIDGKLFDGGSAKDFDLILGSKSFIDNFEEQIVDMKVGEEKDIKVNFPQNYGAAELAGKPAIFKVTLKGLKTKKLPELDDEFASNVSEFDTIDEYKESVKKELLENKEERRNIEVENKLVEKIVDNATIELSDAIINAQLDILMKDMEKQLSRQGLKLDDFAKFTNKSLDEIKNERKKEAEKRVKTSMVLQEIIKSEKIEVKNDDIEQKITEIAQNQGMDKEEFVKTIRQEQLDAIINNVVVEKLLAVLKENNIID